MRMILTYTPDAVETRNEPDEEVSRRSIGCRLAPSTMTTAPRTGAPVTLSRTVPKISCAVDTCAGTRAALIASASDATTEGFTGPLPGVAVTRLPPETEGFPCQFKVTGCLRSRDSA